MLCKTSAKGFHFKEKTSQEFAHKFVAVRVTKSKKKEKRRR